MLQSFTNIYNFHENKFDGDCRQAYQFRPFIMGQFQADGLTWILDRTTYPDEKISEETIVLTRQYEEDKEANLNSFKLLMTEYAENYKIYTDNAETIMNDPATTLIQKTARVEALVEPIKPRLESQPNPLTPSMEKRMQEIKVQQMKALPAASKALEIIKNLSLRLLNAAQKFSKMKENTLETSF